MILGLSTENWLHDSGISNLKHACTCPGFGSNLFLFISAPYNVHKLPYTVMYVLRVKGY